MSQPRSVSRRMLLVFAAFALMMLGAGASIAQAAQSYGEIGKPFRGTGKNEFQLTSSALVHGIGVDPTDNSVFVVDQPKKETEYRVQKFSTGASNGTFLGAVTLNFKTSDRIEGLQGVAVDPGLKRIYVLTVYERDEGEVDGEEFAAGAIYAFKTEPVNKVLVPAEGANPETGLLTSTTAFHSQSNVTGNPNESALLEPAGITVDPVTHEVIVLGHEDRGEEHLLVAAQRIKSNGSLGTRWVDTDECFETEGEEAAAACPQEEEQTLEPGSPTSPVVTNSGRVLVDLSDEVWELPQSFGPNTAPKAVVRFRHLGLQKLLSPPFFSPEEGGGLAFSHEASEGPNEGRIYQSMAVSAFPPHATPAVLVFKLTQEGAASEELGWTAGQVKVEHEACALSAFSQPSIGAGTGEKLFVFDPNEPPGEVQEIAHPQVATFGPGGENCPTTSADAPIATLNGTEVGTAANPAHVGQKVAFSSKLHRSNVLSAEWDFGDGTHETVTKEQFESAKVEHAYTSEGKKTVKVKIKTDSLAQPTVEAASTTITVAATNPVAQFTVSGTPTVGQALKFSSTSIDDNKSPIVKYAWSFGDGGTSSTGPATEHAYGAAGEYTVSLTVTDALGLSGTTSRKVSISSGGGNEPPPPPPPNTNTTTNTTTTPNTKVLGTITAKGNPEAKLASTSLVVTSAGGFPVKISCPTGESSCVGTVTLKTLTAVSAGSGKKKKKAILTLASGSFTVIGGSAKTVTLHLSAKARALLAHSHVLRAQATILAHDSSGASHTTVTTVTLKLAKKKK